MVNIKISVNGANISADASGGLTVGMAGATYEVEYDPSWNGLSKIVIFRAGLNQMVALDGLVPPGVLTAERTMLQVGVEGRNQDGRLIIPTIWTDVGFVLPSASTNGASNIDPDSPAWAQSAAIAQQALEKAERLEQRADSGEFRGEPGPQGPGYSHSEEFSSLAHQIRTDAVTAENAAKLSGRNASHAASASKEADQAVLAAQAEANRAKQEADRAAQGSGGLTAQQQELVLTILRAGVYSSDQSETIDRLEVSFAGGPIPEPPVQPETWSVTCTLTHCTSSNSAVSVAKGQPYSATLIANQGYTLEGADVIVKMGETDITQTSYTSGRISIAEVTGDVTITATAKKIPAGGAVVDLNGKFTIKDGWYWGVMPANNGGVIPISGISGTEFIPIAPNRKYTAVFVREAESGYVMALWNEKAPSTEYAKTWKESEAESREEIQVNGAAKVKYTFTWLSSKYKNGFVTFATTTGTENMCSLTYEEVTE